MVSAGVLQNSSSFMANFIKFYCGCCVYYVLLYHNVTLGVDVSMEILGLCVESTFMPE
jgi:hypothetical protein